MGDNVRYLGDCGAGGVGWSGANGFTSAFVAAASDVLHPTVFSFHDCMEMYWRMKNWKSDTDITIDDGLGGTLVIQHGDMTIGGSNATRELDLIFPISHEFKLTSAGQTQTLAMLDDIYQDSGALYPKLTFLYDQSSNVQVSFDPTVPTGFNAAGSCPATVKAQSLTAYFFVSVTLPGWSVSGTFLDFTGKEWWEHAQYNDGFPVFDTTTGAVLPGRNPTK